MGAESLFVVEDGKAVRRLVKTGYSDKGMIEIIEGIEETVMKGGGYFLWTGCAAGDSGAALILKIG